MSATGRLPVQTEVRDAAVEPRRRADDGSNDAWTRDARAAVVEPGCYLLYLDPDGAPTTVRLDRNTVRVGRSLSAQVRFEDPSISRRHALIVRYGDNWRVVDERSLNGLYLNGERVEEWGVLVDGDVIDVGRHSLHFITVPAA